jgi:UDPglucose 6-dehydrogenase
MKITVAGAGYVGLSNAVLLAQKNEVTVLDIIQEKVDMINEKKSPIIDKELEEYLATKEFVDAQRCSHYIDQYIIILIVQYRKSDKGTIGYRYNKHHYYQH